MNKSYVIEWKSQVNGRTGRGTKVFEHEEAHRLADELNRAYPGIHHEVVEVLYQQETSSAPIQSGPAEPPDVAPGVPELNYSPDHAFAIE